MRLGVVLKMRIDRKHMVSVRFIVLVSLLGAPLVCSFSAIHCIRKSYQHPQASSSRGSAETPTPTLPEQVAQQNKQMIDWGVILLGGLIALVTTTKVHRIKHHEWWFLILAPAASFLLGSLWAGVVFQRRAAYLALQPEPNSSDALLGLLSIQSSQFQYALIPLSLFALIFLTAIVLEYVQPYDGP